MKLQYLPYFVGAILLARFIPLLRLFEWGAPFFWGVIALLLGAIALLVAYCVQLYRTSDGKQFLDENSAEWVGVLVIIFSLACVGFGLESQRLKGIQNNGTALSSIPHWHDRA